jgi:hypothetical protein
VWDALWRDMTLSYKNQPAHPYFMIKISQSFDYDEPYNVIIDG